MCAAPRLCRAGVTCAHRRQTMASDSRRCLSTSDSQLGRRHRDSETWCGETYRKASRQKGRTRDKESRGDSRRVCCVGHSRYCQSMYHWPCRWLSCQRTARRDLHGKNGARSVRVGVTVNGEYEEKDYVWEWAPITQRRRLRQTRRGMGMWSTLQD